MCDIQHNNIKKAPKKEFLAHVSREKQDVFPSVATAKYKCDIVMSLKSMLG